MSEMEKNNEVETEEFTEDLSDEALDREEGSGLSPRATAPANPGCIYS